MQSAFPWQPQLIGSALSGLMVMRDLDVMFDAPKATAAEVLEGLAVLARRVDLRSVDFLDERGDRRPTPAITDERWYAVLHTDTWKIDLTFWLHVVDRPHVRDALRLRDCTTVQRRTILRLKQECPEADSSAVATHAMSWSTFGGWLTRDENHAYSLTESGAEALGELSPDELWLEVTRRYHASKREGTAQGVGWEPFLRWSRELVADVDLDAEERDYKLKAAEKWAAAGAACAAGSADWAERLRQAAAAGNFVPDRSRRRTREMKNAGRPATPPDGRGSVRGYRGPRTPGR